SSPRRLSTPGGSSDTVCALPTGRAAAAPGAPTPAPTPDPPPLAVGRCGAHSSVAASSRAFDSASPPSYPGLLRARGAPPASMVFFESLRALAHLLTSHR